MGIYLWQKLKREIKQQLIRPFGLVGLVLVLVGCGQGPALPTQVPVAQLPQASPTSNLPPTFDISTAVPVIETITPAPSSTPKPSRTPLPLSTSINISFPQANELLVLGQEVTVGGLVTKEEDQTIAVSLVTSNGRSVAQMPAELTSQGWGATFLLPPQVSGLAFLQVTLLDASDGIVAEHKIPVLLTLPEDVEGRYLQLFRPEIGHTAVGGYSLFFDGMISFPVNNFVTVSVWANDCQEQVARQGFQLGGSGRPFYWSGFVVVPQDLVGPACAVAHFGEPGTEDWREVQLPIEVLDKTAVDATGVVIARPRQDAELLAGEELFLFGTAYNVSTGPVTISIMMDNGRIVGQSSVQTDYWGYWEASILLPYDLLGLAEILVTAGEDETFSEAVTVINVLPAPTPTAP